MPHGTAKEVRRPCSSCPMRPVCRRFRSLMRKAHQPSVRRASSYNGWQLPLTVNVPAACNQVSCQVEKSSQVFIHPNQLNA